MCMHHALAWSESGLCRDIAQHNSGASLDALSEWISARVTPARGSALTLARADLFAPFAAPNDRL